MYSSLLTGIYLIGTILNTKQALAHPLASMGVSEVPLITSTEQPPLLTRVTKKRLIIPDLKAMTDPEEMLLLGKQSIVILTKRSTKYNLKGMRSMRSLWKYNMTSPRYRRTIHIHTVIINSTMTSQEVADLQYLRWREPFVMSPEELNYYLDLRRKKNFNDPRKCPGCRDIVLDTYEQYFLHSASYDERGYIKHPTPDMPRYPYACHICPERFETINELNPHYLNHSIQLGRYPTFTYPYTEAEYLPDRPTTIVHVGGEDFDLEVFD